MAATDEQGLCRSLIKAEPLRISGKPMHRMVAAEANFGTRSRGRARMRPPEPTVPSGLSPTFS